jgi:ATP-dependent RNA helicase RhlE
MPATNARKKRQAEKRAADEAREELEEQLLASKATADAEAAAEAAAAAAAVAAAAASDTATPASNKDERPASDMRTFAAFKCLDDDLLSGIQTMKFDTPTPIQQSVIRDAVGGRDILAAAVSGSGKTAAFAIPIIQRILDKRRVGSKGKDDDETSSSSSSSTSSPSSSSSSSKKKDEKSKTTFQATRAIVLSPTRELATQIGAQIEGLVSRIGGTKGNKGSKNDKAGGITCGVVFGGGSLKPQRLMFKKHTDIIVACPGRLLELMEAHPKQCGLRHLSMLVIDEADKMLDMGFIPTVRSIAALLPEHKRQRQTLLFRCVVQRHVTSSHFVLHLLFFLLLLYCCSGS